MAALLWWSSLLLALAAVLDPSRVAAEPTDRPQIEGAGSCPDPAAVRAQIEQLTTAERRSELSPLARVVVADDGERYRVDVFTGAELRARPYEDGARDCGQRAKTAAVFAVLTLMPPELALSEPEPALAPPPAAAPMPKQSAPERAPILALELAAAAELGAATGTTPPVWSWGAKGRVSVGRGLVAGLVGGGYTSEVVLETAGVDVGLRSFAIEAGTRLQRRFRFVTLAGDAVLVGLRSQLRGLDLHLPETQVRFDLGLGLRAALRFGRGALAPYAGFDVLALPRPTSFRALPRGASGHVPAVRLALSAGVSLAF